LFVGGFDVTSALFFLEQRRINEEVQWFLKSDGRFTESLNISVSAAIIVKT
jgi:hypothetical protein